MKTTALRRAAEQGLSDLATGRFDDADAQALDEFIRRLGVRAAVAG